MTITEVLSENKKYEGTESGPLSEEIWVYQDLCSDPNQKPRSQEHNAPNKDGKVKGYVGLAGWL